MTADVYSDEGYYAVVPEWVLDSDISAQAVRLYAVLRRYADQRTMHSHPSRKTLAERLRVKDPKVVDRAVVDLERIGALVVLARWRDEDGDISPVKTARHREQTSNGYRVRRHPGAEIEGGGGGRKGRTPPGGPKGRTRVAEKGDEPQPSEPQPEDVTSTSDVTSAAAVDNSKRRRGAAPAPTNDVDLDEVERTVQHLPAQLRPTTRDTTRLTRLVAQRLGNGWTRQAILDVVTRDLRPGTPDNPCGLFAHLVPLAPPTAQAPTPERVVVDVRPWCGHCDQTSRRPLDENGFPDLTRPQCPDCEQLAFATHMNREAVLV